MRLLCSSTFLILFFSLSSFAFSLSTFSAGISSITTHHLQKRYAWFLLRLGARLLDSDSSSYVHYVSWRYGSRRFGTSDFSTRRTVTCSKALFTHDPKLPHIIQGVCYPGGTEPQYVHIQESPYAKIFRSHRNFLGPYSRIGLNESYRFINEEAVNELFPSLVGKASGNTTRDNLAVYQHIYSGKKTIFTPKVEPPSLLEIVMGWNATIAAPGSELVVNPPTSLEISFTCLCTEGTMCSCAKYSYPEVDFYGNLTFKAVDDGGKVRISLARDEFGRGNATLGFTVNGEVPPDEVVKDEWEYLHKVCLNGGFIYEKEQGIGNSAEERVSIGVTVLGMSLVVGMAVTGIVF